MSLPPLQPPESRLFNRLMVENRKLRQRVFELEEQLARGAPEPRTTDQQPTHPTRVLQLIRQKDEALGSYAAELEDKTAQLQKAVEELQRKNLELNNWLAAMRLYQEIFENEPAALIGFDREFQVVHFNRAAVRLFGNAVGKSVLEDVRSLPLEQISTEVREMIDQSMAAAAPMEKKFRSDQGIHFVLVFPLLDPEGKLRGGMLRVSQVMEHGL
jgi:PAS domain S-box-containing protein